MRPCSGRWPRTSWTASCSSTRRGLDTFLAKHPNDQAALFAAVFAQYQATTREHLALTAADRTKLMRYVRAYQGPQQALLTKYLNVMTAR